MLLKDVDLIRWKQELLEDRNRLATLHAAAAQVDASRDAKLTALREMIDQWDYAGDYSTLQCIYRPMSPSPTMAATKAAWSTIRRVNLAPPEDGHGRQSRATGEPDVRLGS